MTEEITGQIATPVTITVDLDALVKSHGYGPRPDTDEAYGGDGLAPLVARMVADRLAPDMKKAVTDLVKEAALDQVHDIIGEVMAGQIQLTNSYGEPIGKFSTLREQIVASVTEQLNAKVNSRGGRAPSYERDAIPYMRWLAKDAADKALKGELDKAVKAAVNEVKQSVADLVTAELGARIAKTVIR